METSRAFGALADSAVQQMSRVGDASQLVLDAEADSYALVSAAVSHLPSLMNAAGRSIALASLAPDDRVQLAVAKGEVETSLTGLTDMVGAHAPLDDVSQRRLRDPLRDVTWGATSLMSQLTGSGGDERGAHLPIAVDNLWT